MHKPLDTEIGKQIIDSIKRLDELEGDGSKIITLDKNLEAEKEGLREYIKNALLAHALHLLGCWHAVKNEYEPLCNVFANITNRAAGIRAQREAIERAAARAAQGDAEGASATAEVNEAPPAPEKETEERIAPPGTPLILNRHRPRK